MWLIDQLAEQHILAAQEKGELSNLRGEGAPLLLEDDSGVPEELRMGYRLLKNAGFLPPELEMRREALEVKDLLRELDPDDHQARELAKKLSLLELKLRQAGMSTAFLQGEYREAIKQHLGQEK
ncbi:DnaJ family domain-containing protein [Pantoea sp. At-9b]|uniref:DnaJ family domain-containing protein n=1 Tax=Pantoea sp. (strain At-9b) TaxID=592316 RepID=UPI0001B3F28C|nr:DnaJ family domain-containing protein [Pantoea sp. At-9b]ADU70905.1 DnaJ-like, subfamily C, member 28, conserved domain protein [Pantoea sp. At-9b]